MGRHDRHLPSRNDDKAWAPGAISDDDPDAQRRLAFLQGAVKKNEARAAKDASARDERGRGRRR